MTKFIIRCDDVGQDLDQSQIDHGMKTFEKWYEPWRGLPIYLGVVPKCCNDSRETMDWLEHNITDPSLIAIHGWDHKREPLSHHDLALAKLVFPRSKVVIPPYNMYNGLTLTAMESLGMDVLLGGFDGEHHHYGYKPVMVSKVAHVPAYDLLYARCYGVADTLEALNSSNQVHTFAPEHPIQIVLHHRWDAPANLDGVKRLRDLVADQMITVEDVKAWLMQRSTHDTA